MFEFSCRICNRNCTSKVPLKWSILVYIYFCHSFIYLYSNNMQKINIEMFTLPLPMNYANVCHLPLPLSGLKILQNLQTLTQLETFLKPRYLYLAYILVENLNLAVSSQHFVVNIPTQHQSQGTTHQIPHVCNNCYFETMCECTICFQSQ